MKSPGPTLMTPTGTSFLNVTFGVLPGNSLEQALETSYEFISCLLPLSAPQSLHSTCPPEKAAPVPQLLSIFVQKSAAWPFASITAWICSDFQGVYEVSVEIW